MEINETVPGELDLNIILNLVFLNHTEFHSLQLAHSNVRGSFFLPGSKNILFGHGYH